MNKLAQSRKTALLGFALIIVAIVASAAQGAPAFYDNDRQQVGRLQIDASNHFSGLGTSVRAAVGQSTHRWIDQNYIQVNPGRTTQLSRFEQAQSSSSGNLARFGKPLLIAVLILVAFLARRGVRLKP